MKTLDTLIPHARLVEIDTIHLATTPEQAWNRIRHGSLGSAPFIRLLFALRTKGKERSSLCIDRMRSSPGKPGFQVLAEVPGQEVAVGAIGKVWKLNIPFEHVANAATFAAFNKEGFIKVAWAMGVLPHGNNASQVTVELRVAATDATSWQKFRRYFLFIGPFSRLIRRTTLASIAREFAGPASSIRHEATG